MAFPSRMIAGAELYVDIRSTRPTRYQEFGEAPSFSVTPNTIFPNGNTRNSQDLVPEELGLDLLYSLAMVRVLRPDRCQEDKNLRGGVRRNLRRWPKSRRSIRSSPRSAVSSKTLHVVERGLKCVLDRDVMFPLAEQTPMLFPRRLKAQ